jgi:hypothetical protein
MIDLKCPEWFATAPCEGNDRVFFSSHPSKRKLAISMCEEVCDHTHKCLNYALDNNMTLGVWGGKTGPELARLLDSKDYVHRV